jgi:hypothetical protein
MTLLFFTLSAPAKEGPVTPPSNCGTFSVGIALQERFCEKKIVHVGVGLGWHGQRLQTDL